MIEQIDSVMCLSTTAPRRRFTPRLLARLGVGVSVTWVATASAVAQPATDGLFDDWSAIPVLATDPLGDASGPLDVTALKAQSRGTRLFVQFDITSTVNLSSGPTSNTTLRLIVTRGARSITVDFRNRTAYLDGNTSNTVSWTALGYVAAPTTAANRFELEVETSLIGAQVGDTVQLNFSGADTLTSSAPLLLSGSPVVPQRRSAHRSPCATLRVASFNTFLSGFADGARFTQFVRLVDAADADVYCFQEEYNGTLAQAQAVINAADPLENGAVWTVVKSGELVIASPYPMITVSLGTAHLAVIVRQPNGQDTLVIDNHLKCCGYIGSSEDAQRISQASAAITSLNAFRAGTLSPALAPYKDIPAIHVGDWNHVGSSTPLDLWLASPGPAFSQAVVRHLIGLETWTWASPGGTGFWPGLLDVVAYDAARTRVVRSFSLDSAELTGSELLDLGLLAGDSAASDHRMVVVDLASGPNADLNADGGVNTSDLTAFLARFGQAAPPGSPAAEADFNGDGVVNTPDLTFFLGRFGTVCD